MQQQLSQLLNDITVKQVVGNTQLTITEVTCDSRQTRPGALWIAVKGAVVDAHQFIPQAVDSGVSAIVCERLPQDPSPAVTWVVVDNSTIALSMLASAWWGHPSRKLRLVGVTGTNGKTTTATLLYELTRLLGYKAGLLSTVRNMVDTVEQPAKQTTPDHLTLNRLLHEMVEAGCDYAFMEVSSHACAQHRIDGLHYTGAIFTNLTRDHMDFHRTMDNYIRAKKMFFDMLPQGAFALVNADDKVGDVMVQNTRAAVSHYSLRQQAEFKCKVVESRLDGTLLNLDGTEVDVLFTGLFNAYNLTAVYATARLLGWDKNEVLVAMSRLVPVDGRFQTLRAPAGFTAIVDYAHTPDALVNVLETLQQVMRSGDGRIITVCGCGGNRDKGKRPIMAREAAQRSDTLILTSDNPRDEDPDAILAEMQQGLDSAEARRKTLVIADRRSAIKAACQMARPGDVVLVAGKGHETYQEIKGVKHHFDDREVLRELFNELFPNQ